MHPRRYFSDLFSLYFKINHLKHVTSKYRFLVLTTGFIGVITADNLSTPLMIASRW